MNKHHKKIVTFEEIESVAQGGSLDSKSLGELNEFKSKLLAETPTSRNPQFQQRWERTYTAIGSKISGKVNARRFRIQIGLSVLILRIGASNLAYSYFKST